MRRVAALTMVLLVLAIAACGSGGEPEPTPSPTPSPKPATATPTPTVVTVEGSVLLASDAWGEHMEPGITCSGSGGYNDLSGGMEVRLYGDGTLVDFDRISPGVLSRQAAEKWIGVRACTFTFSLDVPEGYRFYSVELGRRGEFTYTFDEIVASEALAYTIGDVALLELAPLTLEEMVTAEVSQCQGKHSEITITNDSDVEVDVKFEALFRLDGYLESRDTRIATAVPAGKVRTYTFSTLGDAIPDECDVEVRSIAESKGG